MTVGGDVLVLGDALIEERERRLRPPPVGDVPECLLEAAEVRATVCELGLVRLEAARDGVEGSTDRALRRRGAGSLVTGESHRGDGGNRGKGNHERDASARENRVLVPSLTTSG